VLRHKNFTGLRLAQAADQRLESGFAYGSPVETFDGEFVLRVKVFRGMIPPDDFDAGQSVTGCAMRSVGKEFLTREYRRNLESERICCVIT